MSRIEKLRAILAERSIASYIEYGLDGMNMANLRYICGLRRGRGILLLTAKRSVLIVHPVEIEYARATVDPACDLIASANAMDEVVALLDQSGASSVCLDPRAMTVNSFHMLTARMPHREIRWIDNPVFEMRQCKDDVERRAIARAAELTTQGFEYILSHLCTGVTEHELALELEHYVRSQGADGLAFRTMIAFGEHAALPHSIPSDRRLRAGDLVLFDFGASFSGYCSDMTRTVAYKTLSQRWREIYHLVADAQRAALSSVRSGVAAASVDDQARAMIEQAGYGDAFVHGVGHGVGLQVSERPTLDLTSTERLETNMIVTIEPGVYLPGEGGVRIEDLVAVTEDGSTVLSQATKELLVIG